MPRGGKLHIETRNGAMSDRDAPMHHDRPPGEWVQLLVQDGGVGMPPEVQAHLFEPFFTTKEQGKGTGLGLATVYGIVTQAGGHVHVTSDLGRGTTFQICFPRVRGGAAPSPVPFSQESSTKGSERVLLVEDERSVRDVIARMLRAEGYQVDVLECAEQALALGDDQLALIQLLVTDVIMPGIDGHALATALRRRSPTLRVLYLSGYPREAMSERVVLDSGTEFLSKPFSRPTLLAKIRAILDE